ncbi:hypothetical protein L218DRAFT_371641 [Marasmius fiardii PR-910]|nr:hypothetical protein L218DRAFT_371641 [Marasmius fiardii PR-910]
MLELLPVTCVTLKISLISLAFLSPFLPVWFSLIPLMCGILYSLVNFTRYLATRRRGKRTRCLPTTGLGLFKNTPATKPSYMKALPIATCRPSTASFNWSHVL